MDHFFKKIPSLKSVMRTSASTMACLCLVITSQATNYPRIYSLNFWYVTNASHGTNIPLTNAAWAKITPAVPNVLQPNTLKLNVKQMTSKCENYEGPHDALSCICPIKEKLLKEKRSALMSETKQTLTTHAATNFFPKPSDCPSLPHSNTSTRPNHPQANNLSSMPTANTASKPIQLMCFAAKSVPPGDSVAYANKLKKLFKKHGLLVLDKEDIDFPSS